MLKHNSSSRETSGNNGERKLLATSAAVVALMLPLSFASPAMSIERAATTIDAQLQQKAATPTAPSQTEFDAAKQKFTAQEQVYQQQVQAYNQAKADNLPLPNYQTIISDQDAKVAELNNQINPLLNQLNTVNQSITQINTENSDKLAQLLQAYNNAAQQVTDSQNKLTTIQNKIATQKATVDGANEKAAAAMKDMQAKETNFNNFKPEYEEMAESYKAQKAQYESKLTNIDNEITALKNQIGNLPLGSDEGYPQAREKSAAIQAQIDKLQAEYNSVEAQYNTIDTAYGDLQDEYTKYETAYNSAKAAVDAANAKIQEVNAEVAQDNDTLKSECQKAQTAYDQAVAARQNIEAEYKKQVAAAQAENQKNEAMYKDLEGKVNELTNMVNEYNAKRAEMATQAQNAKTAVDTAYQNALNAYNSLSTLRQAAEQLGTQYNTEVQAYNTQLQDEYNTKLNEYNEAQAKFKAEVEKIKQENQQNGVLSKPAWQGLSFGDGPMRLIADGGLSWDSNAPTITEGNKLYLEIAPNQSATVTYSGNAVKGITFAGKQVNAVQINYYNNNVSALNENSNAVGPVWIGADADIRNGFNACFKIVDPNIQIPIAPGSQFSNYNIADKKFDTVFNNGNSVVCANDSPVNVTMTFLDDSNQPINFSKEMPAAIYIPNIYSLQEINDGVRIYKTMAWSNFSEVVPISGSDMIFENNLYAWGYFTNSKFSTVEDVWINGKFVDNTVVAQNDKWSAVNNPDFYKSCILGVQNSGSSIRMQFFKVQIAQNGSQEVKDYPGAIDVGFNQRFLANIPAVELPLAPTVQKPMPPTLAQPVDLNLTALGDAPAVENVTVPTVTDLTKPAVVGTLGQITPKDVTPDENALNKTTCPAPGVAVPENTLPAQPDGIGVNAPQAPQGLPEAPSVPATPTASGIPFTVHVGTKVTDKDLENHIKTDGKIAKVTPLNGPVNTSQPGVQNVPVKVTYKNGMHRIVHIKITVVGNPDDSIPPASGIPITVPQGTKITNKDLENHIKTDGKIAKVIPLNGPVNTSQPGVQEIPVKVIFSNGKSRIVIIKVTVIGNQRKGAEGNIPKTSDASGILAGAIAGILGFLGITGANKVKKDE